MKKILMIAGEPSGDLHGSSLALELKKLSSQIELLGTGGEKMKSAGVNILFDLKGLAVTGFIDVLKHLFKLKRIQTALLSKIKKEKIDLIILIDYPDFNLRFAKKAYKEKVPIFYYISPQVWAWRKGRIRIIKKYIKKMFVIFKFEEGLYKKENVPVEFIGHPLLDIAKTTTTREEFLKVSTTDHRPQTTDQIIALFPGSRKGLVKKHLPIMLDTARFIHKELPQVKFLLSKSSALDKKIYEKALKKYTLPITVVEGNTYDIINASDFVLAISGTITLEATIIGKPMVVIYKLSLLEYILARPLLRLKNISLVNIVAGKKIVPEFIQFNARPPRIAGEIIDILEDKKRYEDMKTKLTDVKNNLYPTGASKKAALSIYKLLFGA